MSRRECSPHHKNVRTRLGVECLESRDTPAIITVDTFDGTDNLTDTKKGLHEAIRQANAGGAPADNTINFAAALFAGTGPKTISLTVPLPALGQAQLGQTITIAAPSTLTVERAVGAATNFRIFTVSETTNATLQYLTIKGGRDFTTGINRGGGGILANGALTLRYCILDDNQTNGNGGGIRVESQGRVTLDHSAVINSRADGNGGGIYVLSGKNGSVAGVTPSLDVSEASEVRNNSAEGKDGGIYFDAYDPWTIVDGLRVTGSKVNTNTAKLDGGGLYVALLTSRFSGVITDSEVKDNRSREGKGGAIFTGGKIVATNSHFDANRGALAAGYAVAVDISYVATPLELVSCSVINNTYIGAAGLNPAAVDAGSQGIKFGTTNVTGNDGNGVKGVVISTGGNTATNSRNTSSGWLSIFIDYIS